MEISNKKAIMILIIVVLLLLIIGFTTFIVCREKSDYYKINKLVSTDESNIPKVYITGNIDGMTKQSGERDITVKYVSDDLNFESYGTLKVQGVSSTYYPKKNYTLKLYKTEDHDKKYKVDVGYGNQSKYCLKANFIDKTHARNIVSAKIAGELQRRSGVFMDAPNNGLIDGYPVAVFMNNEYWGIYTFNIPKDEWTWNLDKDNPKVAVVVGDNNDLPQDRFEERIEGEKLKGFKIEVGEENQELIDSLNRLIDFVKNSSDEEFKEHFEEYFDKESAINYILMVYLINGIDNTAKNMVLVTYDQKLWYTSLYDMDITFGTDWNGDLLSDDIVAPYANRSLLWERFIFNFKHEIAERYLEYRKDVFTKEYIMGLFEEFESKIPDNLREADELIWGEFPGYGIDQISEFLDKKLESLDEYWLYDNSNL